MSEFVRAGKVKVLATTGLTRSAVMPEVPTVAAKRELTRVNPIGELNASDRDRGVRERLDPPIDEQRACWQGGPARSGG